MAQEKVVQLSVTNDRQRQEAREVAYDYYIHLINNGWGLFRILEEHGYESHQPKYIPSIEKEKSGWLTEPYVIDCLAQYILDGYDFLL
jgi:hypothetical protein